MRILTEQRKLFMKLKIAICLGMMTFCGIFGAMGYYIGNEWYMRTSIILVSIFGVGYCILSEIEDLQDKK